MPSQPLVLVAILLEAFPPPAAYSVRRQMDSPFLQMAFEDRARL